MKTKIRFLINTLSGGGAEKVLVDLLNQLAPERYELSLVTISGGVHLTEVPANVSVRVIAGSSRLAVFLRKVIAKLPAKLFAMFFLRGQYDVEVAYLEGLPTRFLAAKRMQRGDKYAFVHCDLAVKNIIAPLYKNKAECLAEYKRFTKVCFVSEKSMEGFETAIGAIENACVVHNIVNIERIKALSNEPNSMEYETDGWKLISVGRLSSEKAYDRLLRIVSELEKKYRLELWILGEGDERPRLERMIEELEIKSVRLLGYQKNPYNFVCKADLFICSSFAEGYSTAVTEAVALGVPVITTDCAGMNEILESGENGYIVENSEAGLRNGMINIFESKDKYVELKAAVKEKSDNLTNDRAIREYAALFDSGE